MITSNLDKYVNNSRVGHIVSNVIESKRKTEDKYIQLINTNALSVPLSSSLEKGFILLTCHQRVPTTALPIKTMTLDCCYCVR